MMVMSWSMCALAGGCVCPALEAQYVRYRLALARLELHHEKQDIM